MTTLPAPLAALEQPVSRSGTDVRRLWFARFSVLVLLYNLPVILWGAYVRVSFSGDGCGSNWPFCNGQVLPQRMSVPTAIEWTHRMMTGFDTGLVLLLCLGAFILFPKLHAVRRLAGWSLFFLFVEALLGAGLVLFRFVAKDQSAGRIWYLSAHLTNTMLLLGALTATAWCAYRSVHRLWLRSISRPVRFALLTCIAVSVAGAVAALGDTLFPAGSLAAGMSQDFSSSSAGILRLRFIHPVLAIAASAYLLRICLPAARLSVGRLRTAAFLVVGITAFQLVTGVVNLGLLAPLYLQLFHLFVADVLWMAVLVYAFESTLRNEPEFVHQTNLTS